MAYSDATKKTMMRKSGLTKNLGCQAIRLAGLPRWAVMGMALLLQILLIGGPNSAFSQQQKPPIQSAGPVAILKGDVESLSRRVSDQGQDFKALLALRGEADILIGRAREFVRNLDSVAVPERPGVPGTTQTSEKREAAAVLLDAEHLRDTITDLRRKQVTGRLYAVSFSPFAPAFWSDILLLTVPTTIDQFAELRDLWREHAANNLLVDTAIMVAAVMLLVVAVTSIRGVIERRLMLSRPSGAQSAMSPRAAMLRAIVSLILSAIPIPIALAVLAFIDRQIDFAPNELDPFFSTVILVWAGVSLGLITLRIALQPKHPTLRLAPVSDYQAIVLHRCGVMMILFYGLAIAMDELEGALHILVAISAATTMLWIAACGLCLSWALVKIESEKGLQRDSSPALVEDDEGYVVPGTAIVPVAPARQHVVFIIIQIIGWVVIVVSTLSVLTGYLALGGFVMGRFIVTALLWTLASIFLKAIDVLLTPFAKRVPTLEPLLSRMTTPGTRAGDLTAVVVAGLLRVAILLPMIFVTLGPWHIEYGDVNPFQDAFVGINLIELRDAIGSAGFATICLMIGLTATKILTSWLDGSLLPYTNLDSGVRYSLTTIIGYGGIALSIVLALSQLGISPQSLTVIASALSVGIGFGLQSIVSNFVSGLIVLTERRVRVGDLVSVKGEEGRVRRINVRSTLITTGDNVDLIVPNTDLITTLVRNKTLTTPSVKTRMPLIVAHDADLQGLFDTVMGVTYHHPNVLSDPAPTMTLKTPSPIGLEFEIVFQLADETKGSATRSELYRHWIELLRAEGIFLAQDPSRPSGPSGPSAPRSS